jgi:hypothetical protein
MTVPARRRRASSFRFVCVASLVLVALVAACGDGAVPPTPVVDAMLPPVDAMRLDLGAADMTTPCVDADGDGTRDVACGGTDCDDANPARYPGATEVCDAADLDEDCNPETYGFLDADGDGFPDARCCNGTNCGDDCNDARPGVNPAVPEVCNSVDDDCDGSTDEELLVMIFTDADRDGFGAGTPVTGCPGTTGTVTNGDDCDDARPSTNPGARETCNGTYDDNCDGTVDEGCGCVTGTTRSCGADEIGECVAGTQTCIEGLWAGCSGTGPTTETCNGLDDDCDGMTDEGLLVSGCYSDGDADGFGTGASSMQCRDMTRDRFGFCPAGYTNLAMPVDCNDSIAEIRPDGIERCDTLDNDCDGVVDDVIGLGDACTNGLGACARSGTLACGSGMLVCSAVPGMPVAEACNGLDDDCDGIADNGVDTVFVCRVDADGDGFGVGETRPRCASTDPARGPFGRCPVGYTNTVQLDCDDSRGSVRPMALEVCNLIDDDCDGMVDEGVQMFYFQDADGDGFGSGVERPACSAPVGFVAENGDCDDGRSSVKPGAVELCDGLLDHDCNGSVDDGCACANGAIQACGSNIGLCTTGLQNCILGVWGTCSGASPISEICDGLDQDCDGVADEGVTNVYYEDSDADGFGGGVAVYACESLPGYVENATDCDDALSSVAPGRPEICNGIDDDCDGALDEMCTCALGSTRECGSNVGRCTVGTQTCTGMGYSACSGVAPVVETCDGTDEDCDGVTDEVAPLLAGLTVSCGTMSPAFDSAQTRYQVDAVPGPPRCTVRPTAACSTGLSITVEGTPVASGESISVPLTRLVSAISVRVTSADGMSQTYTLEIPRRSTYIKASNNESFTSFGAGVAVSGDGGTIAVARRGSSESIHILRRDAVGSWAQDAIIETSSGDGLGGDGLAGALSLSADGTALAVGAPYEDSNARGVDGTSSGGAESAGAAYVFRRSAGGVWSREAFFKASNTESSDLFGFSVAISADGATLAVGAMQEDSSASGINGDQTSNSALNAGAVYVFQRRLGIWAQEAYIKASNPGGGSVVSDSRGDAFGQALSIAGDGSVLAVGAPWEDSSAIGVGGDGANNAARNSGAVYVFRRTGVTWGQEAYVKASNTGGASSSEFNGDGFGFSLSMSRSGDTLAVGAPEEDSMATGVDGAQMNEGQRNSGAVYVFRYAAGGWAQDAYVKATNTGSGDEFGHAVALAADGASLFVAALREDSGAVGIGGEQSSESASDAGAVYVFRRDSGAIWAPEFYVKASNTEPPPFRDNGDLFGVSIAVSSSGDTLAVGAFGEDSAARGVLGDQTNNDALNSGAVYVF